MPETFVLYACVVVKPDVHLFEPEARRIDWMSDIEDFIDTEAFAH